MGTYNTLNTEIRCRKCGNKIPIELQFRYGDTWLLKYSISDEIQWGGNDIGRRECSKVKVYGILSNEGICSFCHSAVEEEEDYDILIEDNSIVGVQKMSSFEYDQSSPDYIVLKD